MQIKFIAPSSSRPTTVFGKLLTFMVMGAAIAVALMFSAVVLVVLLVLATFGFGYLWWKTRALRHHLRAQMQQFSAMQNEAAKRGGPAGEIIEGEVVEVSDSRIMDARSFDTKRH